MFYLHDNHFSFNSKEHNVSFHKLNVSTVLSFWHLLLEGIDIKGIIRYKYKPSSEKRLRKGSWNKLDFGSYYSIMSSKY